MSKLSTILLALLWAVAPSVKAQTVVVPDVPSGAISLAGVDAAVHVAQLVRLGDIGVATRRRERLVPPAPWSVRDPADSLYRLARRAMADENYRRAADAFADLVDRYPHSDYAGDALYYRAYCLYQLGGQRDLRDAVDAIEQQARDYADASTREDAKTLRTRIESLQARRGDAQAAQRVQEKANQLGDERGCPKDDDDPRIYALQALMQMDAESALPILRQVLAKRGSCSESLRKQAVFIVSQKRSDEATDLLLQVARADPSSDVRGEAIQWLGQARSPRAVAALDSIAANATDDDILDKAIFALSQTRDERSDAALRRIASDERKSTHARTQAIFWFGQTHRDADDMRFLRDLFGRSRSEEIQGSIIQAMAQAHTPDAMRWLIEIARDKSISIDARKNALFWAGQSGADMRQMISLYDEMKGQSEIQNQLIFVFSQRRDRDAIDKLMDIAKNDSDRDLRKQAIFWLGQSHDPRVQQFLLDLINR
ncbi:MAG TPA: HEAT repeat domain-containing protein [Gemmatimonadaceae bacterium]